MNRTADLAAAAEAAGLLKHIRHWQIDTAADPDAAGVEHPYGIELLRVGTHVTATCVGGARLLGPQSGRSSKGTTVLMPRAAAAAIAQLEALPMLRGKGWSWEKEVPMLDAAVSGKDSEHALLLLASWPLLVHEGKCLGLHHSLCAVSNTDTSWPTYYWRCMLALS